jgi:hypothetical protein
VVETLTDPKIDTRSSRGLLEVPDSKLAAAVCEAGGSTVVAASPEGAPSSAGVSSKSRRFSDCWPAATVCNAFRAESGSSVTLEVGEEAIK